MARSGLRWSLDDLAQQSGVSRRTIARFELGGRVGAQSIDALRRTLEAAGAEFLDNGDAIGVLLNAGPGAFASDGRCRSKKPALRPR